MNAKSLVTFLLGCLIAQATYANAADWHWNEFGTGTYGGQISLRDDQGSALNYQRYSGGASPSLFGSVSAQSPLMVVAGTDITFDIVQSGTVLTKPTCNAPEVAKIYVTPVTVCNFGQGNAIGGINAYATSTATTFTPKLAAWFQGYGWRALDASTCGRVEVKMLCQ